MNLEIIVIILFLSISIIYIIFYFYKSLCEKEEKVCSKCIESKTNFKKKV